MSPIIRRLNENYFDMVSLCKKNGMKDYSYSEYYLRPQ